MIKATPAQIVLREDADFEVKIETSNPPRIDKKDVELVMLTSKNNTLTIQPCATSSASITVGDRIKGNSKKLLEDIAKCQQQNTVPALRIAQNLQSSSNKNVGATEEVIVPLFTINKNSLLLKERTEAVLGQIAERLTISSFTCTPKISFVKQDITCQSTITNTTDTYITTTVVSSYSEKFPQFITKKESILQSNILLLPSQNISTSQIISKNDISTGVQQHELHVTFQEPTSQIPYITSQKAETLYLPWQILLVTASILLGISAILIRNIYDKFKHSSNGHAAKRTAHAKTS